jgi:hypothetical protein
MDDSEVELALQAARDELVGHRNALSERYAILPITDPRPTTAYHLKAAVSAAYLSWIFLRTSLAEKAWWLSTFGKLHPSMQDEVNEYA